MAPEIIYDYDPRNLPEEALAAIGLSVACAAQTEHIVETAIGGLLGLDALYSTAVTTHMTMPLRFHILKAAAEIRISNLDDLDLLDTLLDDIDKAMQKRNEVAHNSWMRNPNDDKLFTQKITARGSVDTKLIPMDIPRIKRDATAIYEAGMELMRFLMERRLLPRFPSGVVDRSDRTVAARKIRRKKLGK